MTKFVFPYKGDEMTLITVPAVVRACATAGLHCLPSDPNCPEDGICTPAKTIGYDITPLYNLTSKTPTKIELRNVGCEFDVYGLIIDGAFKRNSGILSGDGNQSGYKYCFNNNGSDIIAMLNNN